MLDFTFCSPTKIVFGRNALDQLGALTRKLGERVLLVYGGAHAMRSGLLSRCIKILNDSGCTVTELGGVKPNPMLSHAVRGIELGRQNRVEAVLAVGGGSVIDTAKTIAMGIPYRGDVWDFYTKFPAQTALPVAVVLSIPAAGSEASPNAVITKDDGMDKRGCYKSDALCPRFSILNPEFCYSIPPYHVACGISDIIAHVLERYISRQDKVELTDRFCESIMRTVINNAPKVLHNPADYDAWAEIILCSTFAHNNLAGIGRIQNWSAHHLGHEISAFNDTAHGASLSITFPAWMKFCANIDPKPFAKFGRGVFSITDGNDGQTALLAIGQYERFLQSLSLPTRLYQVGINKEDIDTLLNKFVEKPLAGTFIAVDKDIAAKIYSLAL